MGADVEHIKISCIVLAHSVPVCSEGEQSTAHSPGCYSLPLASFPSGHPLTKLVFSGCRVSFQRSVPKAFARPVLFLAGTGESYLYGGGAKKWHLNFVHSGGKTVGDIRT